jgi:thiol-disulfide isomerase/thioredoxin
MNRIFIFILWLLLPSVAFSQEIITGKKNLDELLMTDHRQWFEKSYSEYQPEMSVIQSFPHSDERFKVKIILGTWCSDSRQLIPAFFKVMDLWNFNHQCIEMILVDRSKQIKLKGYKKLHITHVPTIIFYNSKSKEIGRIVETVQTTIEREVKVILEKQKN